MNEVKIVEIKRPHNKHMSSTRKIEKLSGMIMISIGAAMIPAISGNSETVISQTLSVFGPLIVWGFILIFLGLIVTASGYLAATLTRMVVTIISILVWGTLAAIPFLVAPLNVPPASTVSFVMLFQSFIIVKHLWKKNDR